MQKKLVNGNAVSQSSFDESMTMVKVLGAKQNEMNEYQDCMNQYLELDSRNVFGYLGYAMWYGSLSQMATVVVLDVVVYKS